MTQPRTALIGVGGHGAHHRAAIVERERRGELRWVGACDLRMPADLPARVPAFDDPRELLARTRPDVTIVATPPGTHAALAAAAVAAGSDVLLEKPPVTGRAELDAVVSAADAAGRAVQVGFQSLGSQVLPALVTLIGTGALGEIEGVGAAGCWTRTAAYYARAPWAGRRFLDGAPVLDGCLTNPFAHAVAAAFAVAAPAGTGAPADRLEVELYRARPIEADDTACLRAHLPGAPPVLVAVSLCGAGGPDPQPVLVVRGTRGRARWWYQTDELRVEVDGRDVEAHRLGRTDLLDDLLAHRRDGTPLLAPLAGCRAFVDVLEAVRDAGAPRPVPLARVVGDGGGTRHEIDGVEATVHLAAATGRLLSELAPAWIPELATHGGRL